MKFFTTVLPSLLVGGLLFSSVVGSADDGRGVPTPPTPPTAPTPPRPPKPPKIPGAFGSGFNLSVHDGKVTIDGLDAVVDAQINAALGRIANDQSIPPKIRAKLTKRLEKVRAKVKARLSHLDAKDADEIGEELGQLGEEIGEEMEQFGQDMDQYGKDMDEWGKQFGKSMDAWGKQFGKSWSKQWPQNGSHVTVQHDDDPDVDTDDMPDMPDPDDVDDDTVRDLGDLSLSQPQRDTLKRLRADSDAKVAQAKHALEMASDTLEKQLQNPNASDSDIAKSIDAVAQQEAAIRKARILAWVNARRMLDDSQRKKVEGAAKHRSH